MLARLFDAFIRNHAESICMIINEEMPEVHEFLRGLSLPVPLEIVVKSTPDSFHSFCELAPYLQGVDKFCLTTVDPICVPSEFDSYIQAFMADHRDDALMAVTAYVDDERPLYVKTDATLRIVGYSNEACGASYVSGGIYCMNRRVLDLLPEAIKAGVCRMRGFQQYLVDAGLQVQAYPFSKIIDIDHADDIRKAEQFMAECGRHEGR